MPLTRRKRSTSDLFGKFRYSENSGKTWKGTDDAEWGTGSQITDSEGHRINPKTGYRNGGGPFHTVRETLEFPTTPFNWEEQFGFNKYYIKTELGTPMLGLPLPTVMNGDLLGFMNDRASINLDADGAHAIAEVAPTNPNAELAVAIGELLKDGLPGLPGIRLWESRLKSLKALGEEFLNAEFGWLPLINDMKKSVSSIAMAKGILDQYSRDNNRLVRREFEFPVDESSNTQFLTTVKPSPIPTTGYGYPGFVSAGNGFTGMDLYQTVKIRSRKWFSGAFMYHLPDQTDTWQRMLRHGAEANHLLGTTLSPEVLWELTPWSWAIDWFSDAGDVVHNFTQLEQQGLVMRYGYMMHEYDIEVTNQFIPKFDQKFGGKHFVPPRSVYRRTSKRRVEANPYGFGIGWEDLSPLQLAITAALGITRLGRR